MIETVASLCIGIITAVFVFVTLKGCRDMDRMEEELGNALAEIRWRIDRLEQEDDLK